MCAPMAAEVRASIARREEAEVASSAGEMRLGCEVWRGMRSVALTKEEAEEIIRTGQRPPVPELLGVRLAVRRDGPGGAFRCSTTKNVVEL